jgi:hypothetical protein
MQSAQEAMDIALDGPKTSKLATFFRLPTRPKEAMQFDEACDGLFIAEFRVGQLAINAHLLSEAGRLDHIDGVDRSEKLRTVTAQHIAASLTPEAMKNYYMPLHDTAKDALGLPHGLEALDRAYSTFDQRQFPPSSIDFVPAPIEQSTAELMQKISYQASA